MDADERPTKICPDCAETVLDAARVCRFCGYRFDTASGSAPHKAGGLGSLFQRPERPPVTLPTQLAQWQITLEEHEAADRLDHCTLDDTPGFLLVTSARILFVQARRGVQQRPTLARPLHEIVDVRLVRHRLRRDELVLEWPDSRTTIRGLPTGDLERIRQQIVLPGLTEGDAAG